MFTVRLCELQIKNLLAFYKLIINFIKQTEHVKYFIFHNK